MCLTTINKSDKHYTSTANLHKRLMKRKKDPISSTLTSSNFSALSEFSGLNHEEQAKWKTYARSWIHNSSSRAGFIESFRKEDRESIIEKLAASFWKMRQTQDAINQEFQDFLAAWSGEENGQR